MGTIEFGETALLERTVGELSYAALRLSPTTIFGSESSGPRENEVLAGHVAYGDLELQTLSDDKLSTLLASITEWRKTPK